MKNHEGVYGRVGPVAQDEPYRTRIPIRKPGGTEDIIRNSHMVTVQWDRPPHTIIRRTGDEKVDSHVVKVCGDHHPINSRSGPVRREDHLSRTFRDCYSLPPRDIVTWPMAPQLTISIAQTLPIAAQGGPIPLPRDPQIPRVPLPPMEGPPFATWAWLGQQHAPWQFEDYGPPTYQEEQIPQPPPRYLQYA